MRIHPRELVLIYNGTSKSGKETFSYAHSLTPYVHGLAPDCQDLKVQNWHDILQRLNMHAEELLDKNHPDYKKACLSAHKSNWPMAMRHYGYLLKAPIALKFNRAVLCQKPKDLHKLVAHT